MCGRFSLYADDEHLVALFDIDLLLGEHAPTYNQAPGQQVRAVLERAPRPGDADRALTARGRERRAASLPVLRELRTLKWGLVPAWAASPVRPIINARAETATAKPSFRGAAARRRCLIPANGYFEWEDTGARRRQPWFLSAGEGDPVVAFAGFYEAWRDPAPRGERASSWLLTCAIVTRSAPDALGRIHDRMPVVVPRGLWDAWLDPGRQDREEVQAMLDAMPPPTLAPRKVGYAVGSVRNDGPELVQALE